MIVGFFMSRQTSLMRAHLSNLETEAQVCPTTLSLPKIDSFDSAGLSIGQLFDFKFAYSRQWRVAAE